MNKETIEKTEYKLKQLKKDKRQTDMEYASNITNSTATSIKLKEEIRVLSIKLKGYERIYKGEDETKVKEEINNQLNQ